MTKNLAALFVTSFLAQAILPGTALPTLIVQSGQSKCVSMEAAMDTVVKVEYNAPDLILDTSDPDYLPSYISIAVTPHNRIIDPDHPSPVQSRLKPTVKLLEAETGAVQHKFEIDGEANICFKSPAPKKISAVALGKRFFQFSYRVRIMDGLSEPESREPADVNDHLTHMEAELKRIQRGMQSIIREADFAKEREVAFHKQTEEMANAVMFWPMVQVLVLLMTGFTQATHIVDFFKKRRLI